MKFLAVLAVLAMAFAAFAVISPEETDAASKTWTDNITTDKTIAEGDSWTLGGNPSVLATLTIEGTLTLDDTHQITIGENGKIVIANGGKIIAGSATKPIKITAEDADAFEVKAGGIVGYYASETGKINDYAGILGLATGDCDATLANLGGFDSAITMQMVTGPFTVSTVGSYLAIKGTVSAASLAPGTEGKAVPRMAFYGKDGNAAGYPVTTSSDLTIGAGVYAIAHGLMVSEKTTVYVNGILNGCDTGDFQLANNTTAGGKVVINGLFFNKISTDENTVGFAVPALGDDITYNAAKSLTGYTVQQNGGDVYLNGNISLSDSSMTPQTLTLVQPITIPSGSNLTFANDVSLTANGQKITNNGVLVLRGTAAAVDNNKTIRLYGTITGALCNEGTIEIMDANADITGARTGSGSIDITGVSQDATLSGDVITSGTSFTKTQTVTLIGDTVIKAGADVTFNGNLIVPEGITLTIEDGGRICMNGIFSKLTNNGEIYVDGVVNANLVGIGALHLNGGEVINNNLIVAEYETNTQSLKPTISIAENTIVTNNGLFTVGEYNLVSNATTTIMNAAGATISISGDMTGTIVNSGSVEINSETDTSAITVKNAAADASVIISSTAGNVTVDDSKFLKPSDKKFVNGGNSVVITLQNNVVAGGITITSGTYKTTEGTTTMTNTTLVIAGAFSADREAAPEAGTTLATITLTGKSVSVDSMLSLSQTTLVNGTSNDAKGTLYVSGIVVIDDTCIINNEFGTITVPGLITSYVVPTNAGTINAAQYTIPANSLLGTKKTYVYTNVPDAIAGAVLEDVSKVTVTGQVDVDESIGVPEGMDFTVSEGAVMTISKDVVMGIIYSETGSATLKNNGTIDVNGKLVIENVNKSLKGTGPINSEVIVTIGHTAIYTTLAWAISDVGTEEATIKLSGATTISKDTTIPENVIVDTNGQAFTVSTGAILTVDGGLYINGGAYTVADEKGVVVNGLIKKDSVMNYDGKGYPAGLYFSTDDFAYYYIGNIDDAETYALVADNNALVYKGELTATSISFDVKGDLTFEEKVKALSLETGSKAKVTFMKDVEIAAVTADADSTIVFAVAGTLVDGLFTSPVGSIAFDEVYTTEANSQIAVATSDGITTMTLSGGYTCAEEKSYHIATLGDVTIKAKNLTDLSVGLGTTTIGAKTVIDSFEVYGLLVIDSGNSLTAKEGDVYGSFVASAATETAAKATASVKYLAVGITYVDAVGDAALVAGDVNVTERALVSAGSTIPETIMNMPYSTVIFVEGKVFMTAFATATGWNLSDINTIVDFGISDSNAVLDHWEDADGNTVANPTISNPDAIYAIYDYNVYHVGIVTDAGVKSVAIDGIEMIAQGNNTFANLLPLKAGTYKVTYTMKSGYEGNAQLYTKDGTFLKDNGFVISPGGDLELIFQLTGTEPIPEPEPTPAPTPEEQSEWTITTILLVILVILIAIMAVIVALRLNRS